MANSQSQTAFYSPETPTIAAAPPATELMSAGDGQRRARRDAPAHALGELADDDLLDVLAAGRLKHS
jgi:hypothetical protein